MESQNDASVPSTSNIDNLASTLESDDELDDESERAIEEFFYEIDPDPLEEDHENDNTIPDYVFEWKVDEFVAQIHQFDTFNSGVKFEVNDEMQEIDYFKKYIDEGFMNHVVKETNKQFIFCTTNVLSNRMKKWVDTTIDEMYTFLALCFLMARNSRNNLPEHWSTDALLFSPIYSDTMTRNRFQMILRMLHFSDNTQQGRGNRLHKIRPIVDDLRKKFKDNFYPFQNICIDESVMLFNGRLIFPQYIPSNTSRFGIKLFVMCDCKSGAVLDFIVYTGATTDCVKIPNLGVPGNIVMTMMSPYLESGHSLYVDNWYTSQTLFETLHKKKTNTCSTVRKNRMGMPKLNEVLKIGESKAIEYSKNMGGVDRSDEMISYTESIRNYTKWYKKLFFHLLDLSLFNAHACYMQKTKKYVSLGDFQLEVIRQLISKHGGWKPINRKRKATDVPSRMNGRDGHFMELIKTQNGNDGRKRCFVCINTQVRKKKRVETKYSCKKCNVALCAVPCFETYHTQVKF